MAKIGDTVDWQDGKSISECMIYMLEKEIMFDVTFRVGTDQTIIKAHKYMLASRSPVFYTMFEGSCPEKGEIIVPDINPEIFKALLKCIYSDKLEVAFENISEALYVVVIAVKISKENIEANMKLDPMSCSESTKCRFLIMWLSHQCEVQGKTVSGENMRKIIGSLLYLVNFPFLNREYFAKQIAHSGLLTSEEVVSVFSSHYGRKNEFFTGSVGHSRVFHQHYTVLRHGSTVGCWDPYEDIINYDALNIKVNKNIELKSVILYGPNGDVSSSAKTLTVKILNDSGNEIYSQKYESCTESQELQTVNLNEPIKLDSNKYFTIILVGLTFKAHSETKCKPEYRIDDVIVTFQKSLNCTTTTNEVQGQIAGIEFNI